MAVEEAPAAALTAPKGSRLRLLALSAGVGTVWSLLFASAFYPYPLFIVFPRIHRLRGGWALIKGVSDCGAAMSQGSWREGQSISCTRATQWEFATCAVADKQQRHWRFSQRAQECGARRLDAPGLRKRLAGQTLVFAGDSLARHMWGAALRLLGRPGADKDAIMPKHYDLQRQVAGNISLLFIWAPFPSDLTAWLNPQPWPPPPPAPLPPPPPPKQKKDWRKRGKEQVAALPPPPPPPRAPLRQLRPTVVLLSTTVWHASYIMAPDDFGRQVAGLARAAAAYQQAASQGGSSGGSKGTSLVFATSPETYPHLIKERQKMLNLVPANLDAYNQATEQAGLLPPEGPFGLLNLFPITQQCGPECSKDGYHSQPEVYDAAFQMLLNIAGVAQQELPQPQQQLLQPGGMPMPLEVKQLKEPQR